MLLPWQGDSTRIKHTGEACPCLNLVRGFRASPVLYLAGCLCRNLSLVLPKRCTTKRDRFFFVTTVPRNTGKVEGLIKRLNSIKSNRLPRNPNEIHFSYELNTWCFLFASHIFRICCCFISKAAQGRAWYRQRGSGIRGGWCNLARSK